MHIMVRLGTCLVVIFCLAVSVRADDSQQSAYRSSVAQEAARKDAEKIRQEIDSIINEMKLNGFSSQDLALLTKTSSNLSNLSEEDMRKVISALQSASAGGDQQKNMLAAYQGQKDISVRLQKLAAEFTVRQVIGTIQLRLQNLMLRQGSNIRNTQSMDAPGMTPDKYDQLAKSTGAVINAEQNAIGSELGLLVQSIQSALSQAPADAPVGVAKTVLDTINTSALKDNVDSARQLTSSGQYRSSLPKQGAIYDTLAQALRAALLAQGPESALAQVQRQLEQLIADQQNLIAANDQDKPDKSALARQQARLQDSAALIVSILKTLNADAAGHVSRAGDSMQQGQDALWKDQPFKTVKGLQQAANDELGAAQKLLAQQIAQVQQQQQDSLGKQLADLKALLNDVKQEQAAVQQAPDRKQAGETNQLAQRALANEPDAANKLFDAANKLQQDPQANQQAAVNQLAQAADQLQKQADAIQQMATDYQKLDQANQQLAQAQQQTQQAQQNLQQQDKTADAAQQLMQAQQQLDQIKQNGLPQQAQQAMQQAQQDLKNAVAQAAQAKGQQAAQQAQQGQQAMQQAQNALGQAMQEMKQQLGQQLAQGTGNPQYDQQDQEQDQPSNGAGGAGNNKSALAGSGADINKGGAQVVGGLSPKDRDAINQSAAQKTPQEFTQAVQQYLKNLANATDSPPAQ
ncbi:MAG: hypothetical protein LBH01_03820 [Verrucomicrobiales bacterium]|nr:hypothetical protein [Verrucomicrobiales bacterium]